MASRDECPFWCNVVLSTNYIGANLTAIYPWVSLSPTRGEQSASRLRPRIFSPLP